MLRLSKLTDYGMLLMSQLASSTRPVWKATELAEATTVPAPTVSKLLQLLLQHNLLISQRGAHGGYSLSRSAATISVREVVDALEGEIALTECSGSHSQCAQQSRCSTRAGWMRINSAVGELLSSITLADLTQTDAPGNHYQQDDKR
ncbi:MAG: SUF system Fe-S cluster assembly regulator [Mariprofundales bacterium]|nr:SUF system Fe-S cluster assembly regulator [Mariprofundales bacterium]